MHAAIYARKSNEQKGVAEEAKSVTRQVDGARTFIAAKGWTLDDAHVYVDDGISGGLWDGRPALQQMLRDAEARAFEAIVVYDLDRLGRDGHETMSTLHTLYGWGVDLWDFSTGSRKDLTQFETRLPVILEAEFAEQYRVKVSKNTKAAKRRSAEQGYVTGGKLFGYDNVSIGKNQTVRRVNEAEAGVVRAIYTRFAAGEGLRTIALALNEQGALSPRAQKGRANGWGAGSVRDVLARPTYRGTVIFGKTRSVFKQELQRARPTKKEKGQLPAPEASWLIREDASLRIIDSELAARVDARREHWRRRQAEGKVRGRAPHRAHGRYLLSGGMLQCPTCGGHFEAYKSPWNRDGVYVCATRRRKPGVCTNTLALPIVETDNTILEMVEGEVLGGRYIEELLALVDRGDVDETPRLQGERDRLRVKVNNLVMSIAGANVPASSVAPLIQQYERDIAVLEQRLRAPRSPKPNVEALRAALEQRAADWKREPRAEPQVARLLLRRLVGPLVLFEPAPDHIPEGREGLDDSVAWEALTKPGILEGLAPIQVLASPTGPEGTWTVELPDLALLRKAA